MTGFNIGDQVTVVRDFNIYVTAGMMGTIVCTYNSEKTFGIKFPSKLQYGSNLNGLCEYGYGYYVSPEFLKKNNKEINNLSSNKKNDFLPSDVKDVIIHNNTVVVNLKDGRKGISKCSDEDTFDTYCGFVNAYYRAKYDHIFDLKNMLNNCVKSAEKKGYKQAILKNN